MSETTPHGKEPDGIEQLEKQDQSNLSNIGFADLRLGLKQLDTIFQRPVELIRKAISADTSLQITAIEASDELAIGTKVNEIVDSRRKEVEYQQEIEEREQADREFSDRHKEVGEGIAAATRVLRKERGKNPIIRWFNRKKIKQLESDKTAAESQAKELTAEDSENNRRLSAARNKLEDSQSQRYWEQRYAVDDLVTFADGKVRSIVESVLTDGLVAAIQEAAVNTNLNLGLEKEVTAGNLTLEEVEDIKDIARQILSLSEDAYTNYDAERELHERAEKYKDKTNYRVIEFLRTFYEIKRAGGVRVCSAQALTMIASHTADRKIEGFCKEFDIPIHENQRTLSVESQLLDLTSYGDYAIWPAIKEVIGKSSPEFVQQAEEAEEKLVTRLYAEFVIPGGRESSQGSIAAIAAGYTRSPYIYRNYLEYVQRELGGHTVGAATGSVRLALTLSNIEAIRPYLSGTDQDTQEMLLMLGDINSPLMRYGDSDSDRGYKLSYPKNTRARAVCMKYLERAGKDYDKRRFFFYDIEPPVNEEIDAILEYRTELQSEIIAMQSTCWLDGFERILNRLASGKDPQSVQFFKDIASDGLGVNQPELLEKLQFLAEQRRVKDSLFKRRTILEGLLVLNATEGGRSITEKTLQLARASKDGADGFQRIMRYYTLLSDLNSVSEVDLDCQSWEELEERVQATLFEKVAERFSLPGTGQTEEVARAQELMQSGAFVIGTTLLARFESRGFTIPRQLVIEAINHEFAGDFEQWKFRPDRNRGLIEIITEDQLGKWAEIRPEVKITIEMSKEEEQRGKLAAVREICQSCIGHIAEEIPQYPTDLNALTRIMEEQEYPKLGDPAKQTALAVVTDLLVAIGHQDTYDESELLNMGEQLVNALRGLGVAQARTDIEQIARIVRQKSVDTAIAREFRDILSLFKIGTVPIETCQSWRKGMYNECLMATVVDANKEGVNVYDQDGTVISRHFLKLTQYRAAQAGAWTTYADAQPSESRRCIFAEREYTNNRSMVAAEAGFTLMLDKAIYVDESDLVFSHNYEPETLERLKEIAEARGYEIIEDRIDIFFPQSANDKEYSDAAGGVVTAFGTYHNLNMPMIICRKKPNSVRRR